MRITLISGRAVSLGELHQWRTYAGLLAGKPDARTNGDLIEKLIEDAKQFVVKGGKPFLVEPDPAALADRLPAISCIGVFDSNELTRPGSEPYSSLAVVWFQEEFGPPMAGATLESIHQLDWESLAQDWIW